MKNRRDNEDRKPPQEVQHLNNRKSVKREDGKQRKEFIKELWNKISYKDICPYFEKAFWVPDIVSLKKKKKSRYQRETLEDHGVREDPKSSWEGKKQQVTNKGIVEASNLLSNMKGLEIFSLKYPFCQRKMWYIGHKGTRQGLLWKETPAYQLFKHPEDEFTSDQRQRALTRIFLRNMEYISNNRKRKKQLNDMSCSRESKCLIFQWQKRTN